MKITNLLALLLVVQVVACDEGTGEAVKTITVDPDEQNVDFKSQVLTTTVTGAATWTLEGECLWITPSATSGVDGDTVEFTVAANTTDKVRAASFDFVSGKASARYIIKQTAAGEPITVTVSIIAVESSNQSVTVDVDVATNDISAFSTFGVAYSTGTDTEQAEEFEIDDDLEVGTTRVTVPDLEEGKIYNFWGWVVDAAGAKTYSNTYVTISTGLPIAAELTVTGANNLMFGPGTAANYTWTVVSNTVWNAELVKGGCIGTDPGTEPTLNVNKSTGVVAFSYTAPAQVGKFRRQWTVKITAGDKSYYASVYENSNRFEDTPAASSCAIHGYQYSSSTIEEGTYQIFTFTSGWRYAPAYNGQADRVLAMWSNNLAQYGQGIDGGVTPIKLWRVAPTYCFDIESAGSGTWYIRPFGSQFLGLGIEGGVIKIAPEFSEYKWNIAKATYGYNIYSADGYIRGLDIADNGAEMLEWITYSVSSSETAARHIQLYRLDPTGN